MSGGSRINYLRSRWCTGDTRYISNGLK